MAAKRQIKRAWPYTTHPRAETADAKRLIVGRMLKKRNARLRVALDGAHVTASQTPMASAVLKGRSVPTCRGSVTTRVYGQYGPRFGRAGVARLRLALAARALLSAGPAAGREKEPVEVKDLTGAKRGRSVAPFRAAWPAGDAAHANLRLAVSDALLVRLAATLSAGEGQTDQRGAGHRRGDIVLRLRGVHELRLSAKVAGGRSTPTTGRGRIAPSHAEGTKNRQGRRRWFSLRFWGLLAT